MANDGIGLVVLAQSGDLSAFAQLARELEPQLRRYVRRLAGDRPAVDDILQETMLRIWRGLPWLDDATVFRAWVYRIATREAYRAMKREHAIEERRADSTELDTLEAPFIDPAKKLDAERHLANVSPLARGALVAHFFEGLTLEDVSAVTGVPLGTVKSRLASGLAQLRQLMGETP